MTRFELITLILATWGAVLSTYKSLVEQINLRKKLALWTYWTATFAARVQNIGARPITIAEVAVRGRSMIGLSRFLFRPKDEEFQIIFPVDENRLPVVLQPLDTHTQTFDELWDNLQDFEDDRRRQVREGGLNERALLPIRYLVVLCRDGEGRTHTSKPYDLQSQPAPVYTGDADVFVFQTPLRLPEGSGPQKAPWLFRALTWLRGRKSSGVSNTEKWSAALEIYDDTELCKQLSQLITSRPDFRIGAVPEHERVVVVVMTTQNIMDQGGFDLFFSKPFPGVKDFEYFIEAYNLIGSPEASSAIQQAQELFPDGSPQEDIEERRAYIQQELAGENGRFSTLELEIRGKREIHISRLATYIRTNKDRFLRSARSV